MIDWISRECFKWNNFQKVNNLLTFVLNATKIWGIEGLFTSVTRRSPVSWKLQREFVFHWFFFCNLFFHRFVIKRFLFLWIENRILHTILRNAAWANLFSSLHNVEFFYQRSEQNWIFHLSYDRKTGKTESFILGIVGMQPNCLFYSIFWKQG